MKFTVIVAHNWYQDTTRYSGHQSANLDEQITRKVANFFKRVGEIKIVSIHQSLAQDDDKETALLTIFYEEKASRKRH